MKTLKKVKIYINERISSTSIFIININLFPIHIFQCCLEKQRIPHLKFIFVIQTDVTHSSVLIIYRF